MTPGSAAKSQNPLVLPLACALYVPAGLILGGVLTTGQAEPLRWCAVSLYFAALLAFVLRRDSANMANLATAAPMSALTVFLFCGVAGQFWSWSHALLLGAINLALLLLMGMLFRTRHFAGLILAAALLVGLLLPARVWLWPLDAPAAQKPRPELSVMTALPLGPIRGGDIPQVLRGKAGPDPVATELSRYFQLQFIDFLSPSSLRQKRLFLAHPRALQPAELVALDDWVRGGGKTLILADPSLNWPSGLPLGDPRRPPVTSLLDPLLAHWGLILEPAGQSRAINRRRMANGRMLATAGESRFRLSGRDCILQAEALLARCRLGRGEVLLVADADLLNPALWMGADGTHAGRNRISDNMQLVVHWLGVGESALAPRTGWILKPAQIRYGFAAALLLLLCLAPILGWRGKQAGR